MDTQTHKHMHTHTDTHAHAHTHTHTHIHRLPEILKTKRVCPPQHLVQGQSEVVTILLRIHNIKKSVLTVPYNTRFWREKILANLMNWKRFAKIFLSKIFLPKSRNIRCITSQLNSPLKLNSYSALVILRIDSKFYRPWIAASQPV